jgi:hypothetical protein
MSEAEPDGCYFTWDVHTCLEDLAHDGDHECSCGATRPTDPAPAGWHNDRKKKSTDPEEDR